MEWKSIITSRINEHHNRRAEIEVELESLLDELVELNTAIQLVDDLKLIWEVKIGNKTVAITQEEVAKRQLRYPDDSGGSEPLEQRGDLSEALKGILISKFTWAS